MGILCSELMTDEAFLEQVLTGEAGGIEGLSERLLTTK